MLGNGPQKQKLLVTAAMIPAMTHMVVPELQRMHIKEGRWKYSMDLHNKLHTTKKY